MNNQDILYASLLGSSIIKSLPKYAIIQNELQKHVLPKIPFPLKNVAAPIIEKIQPQFEHLNEADKPLPADQQFFPLSFSADEGKTWFTLPYEPMVSISGKNTIIRRNVAKWNADFSGQLSGSIKERWSQDDYEITITGVLIGNLLSGTVADCFPRADFEKLKTYVTSSKDIRVNCPPLELLGINNIVIEDFQFPFTKGENVQAYEIKAYSDFSYNLLIEI